MLHKFIHAFMQPITHLTQVKLQTGLHGHISRGVSYNKEDTVAFLPHPTTTPLKTFFFERIGFQCKES
jgi:hypothetical protein